MSITQDPHFVTISVWVERTGISQSVTYQLIAADRLRARKVGRRTLVDFAHGLAWLEQQPLAKIAPPFRRAQSSEVV